MSARHPVIAVTGSSGAGTTTTSLAFRKIFAQLNLRAAEVEGDSFHSYTRPEMDMAIRKARDLGKHISYFGPEANDFGLLEQTFIEYGQSGKGQSRKYLHTYDEAVPWNQVPGTFTPWQPLPEPTDVLFYEGLHGGVVTPQHDVARHVDLLVGVVPIVNLEWIQKLTRDMSERGHSREAVMDSVVRSMEDYINYLTPQFSRTHINFQRVPTVDTSNPFAAKTIPSLDETAEKLKPIQGQMPDPTELPEGCAFAPRCPYATGACRTRKPEMTGVGGTQMVRCLAHQGVFESPELMEEVRHGR